MVGRRRGVRVAPLRGLNLSGRGRRGGCGLPGTGGVIVGGRRRGVCVAPLRGLNLAGWTDLFDLVDSYGVLRGFGCQV